MVAVKVTVLPGVAEPGGLIDRVVAVEVAPEIVGGPTGRGGGPTIGNWSAFHRRPG